MLRLRVDLGFASSGFMLRISSSSTWLEYRFNFILISISKEMVRKEGSSRSGRSQGVSIVTQGKLCFSMKLDFFYHFKPSSKFS